MINNPWESKQWSERQAAWFMAGLDRYEFEPGKVEGETDDAFHEMVDPEYNWGEYYYSKNSRIFLCLKPISAPTLSRPTTPEGRRAFDCLEKLRKAVKWGELRTVDGKALCWTGKMWQKISLNKMSENEHPFRFSIDQQDLKRWIKTELKDTNKKSGGHINQPDGFYVAGLLLAWKTQDVPKDTVGLILNP